MAIGTSSAIPPANWLVSSLLNSHWPQPGWLLRWQPSSSLRSTQSKFPSRFVHAPTTKLALEVGCSASASSLVLAVPAVSSSVTSVHFGDASAFAAKKLFVGAKASTRHLILSVAAIRSAIAFPRGRNTATFETGKLILDTGRKGSALRLVLTSLAVDQRVTHLARYEKI